MPGEYIIGSGMTEKDLQLANWWVRNRARVSSIIRNTLIVLNVIFWGFVLWSLLDAYIISYPREARIPGLIAQNQLAASGIQSSTPLPLIPSDVKMFLISGNRKDFLAQLSNTNKTWWAEFSYHFLVGDKATNSHQSYILPNKQRYITELGSSIEAPSKNAKLIIDDIRWHRIDPQAVDLDYTAFAQNRLQFAFTNTTYKRDLQIGTQFVGQTSTIFNNPSPYGFWNVDLTIILYQGNTPVGVTTVSKEQVKPGSNEAFAVNWFDNLNGITRTEITADVNILDPKAYFP